MGDVGQPGVETCNGLDDDCDGAADEDYPDLNAGCTNGQGVCEVGGLRICAADGQSTRCNAVPDAPGVEACNGRDDDCDGLVDEDDNGDPLTRALLRRRGGHRRPWRLPRRRARLPSGRLGVCQNQVVPVPESCNGADDDCDGTVDLGPGGEPLSSACYDGPANTQGRGVCRAGTAACVNGATGPLRRPGRARRGDLRSARQRLRRPDGRRGGRGLRLHRRARSGPATPACG